MKESPVVEGAFYVLAVLLASAAGLVGVIFLTEMDALYTPTAVETLFFGMKGVMAALLGVLAFLSLFAARATK